MKLKPKTARRLLLVGVAVVLLVVCALALVVGRSWQNERRTAKLRQEGFAAAKAGDYLNALEPLSNYLRRKPNDREAWLAIAEAREKVEEPNGRHIVQAADFYARANTLGEDDTKTALKLARLWNTIGKFPEAQSLCERDRPADLATAETKHLDFLIEEASARIATKDAKQAKLIDTLTDRIVALDPDNFRGLVLRTSVLLDTDRRDDAVSLAQAAVARKPDDARFAFWQQIVLARAGRTPADQFEARFYPILCSITGLDTQRDTAQRLQVPTYTDLQFIGQLVSAFDTLGKHRHSLMVLKDAAERLADPDANRVLARRLWQAGRSPELITRSAAPTAAPTAAPSSTSIPALITPAPDTQHSETLAFTALAFRDTGKPDEAKSILKTLQTRDRDFNARAWAKLLAAELDTPDPKLALAAIDGALKENPAEPVFIFFRGEALQRLRRLDEARTAWRTAEKSPLATGWAGPSVRIAETLLDEVGLTHDALGSGQLDEAAKITSGAIARWPYNPSVQMLTLRSAVASIEAGRDVSLPDQSGRLISKPGELLPLIRQIATRLSDTIKKPEDQLQFKRLLLPPQVALLIADNHKPEAVALVQQIIAEPGLLDSSLARRLSAVSTRTGLGIEPQLVAAAGKAGPVDAASLFEQALTVDDAGKNRDAALSLLDEHFARSPADRKAESAAVRAQFHDSVRQPDALATWKAAVKDFPDSLGLHLAAIKASAPLADAAFVDAIAARLTALGGSDGDKPSIDVRLAKARARLFVSSTRVPTPRDKSDAVASLRTLVAEAPSRLDLRTVLVDALLLESSPAQTPNQAAIKNKATAGAPPDAASRLTADYASAIEQLAAAAPLSGNPGPLLLAMADILRRQGKFPESIAELSKLTLNSAASNRDRLTAAERLADFREYQPALRGVESLLPGLSITKDFEEYFAALSSKASLQRALRLDAQALETYRLIARQPFIESPSESQRQRLSVTIVNAAVALRSLGDNAAAAALLQRLGSIDLKPVDRALALGSYAAAIADGPATIEQFTRAKDFTPDDPRPSIALARFYLSRPGELAKAEAVVRDAQSRIPNNPDLEILLQQVLLASQSPETANLKPLADALAKHPSPVIAKRAEVFRALIAARDSGAMNNVDALTKLASEFSDDAATQLFVGRRLLSLQPERQVGPAAEILRAAAARFPADPAIQDLATKALIETGQWEQALVTATAWSALSRQPDANLAIAEAHAALGRPKLALEAVRSFVLPPSISDSTTDQLALGVLNVRTRASLGQGDSSGALSMLTGFLSGEGSGPSAVRTRIALPAAAALTSDSQTFETWMAAITPRLDSKSAAEQIALANAYAAAAVRPKFDAVALAARSAAAASSALALDPASLAALTALANAQLITIRSAGPAGLHVEAANSAAAATIGKLLAAPDLTTQSVLEVTSLAEQLGNFEGAVGLYERHLASAQAPIGFPLAIVKNNLAFLMLQQSAISGKTETLAKAKTLAEEAIKIGEVAPFLETLGAINAAMKQPKIAVEAYRRALKLSPNSLASKIGLASALSEGSPPEQAEAGRIVGEVDSQPRPANTLSDQRLKQLEATRQRLVESK